MSATPAVIDNRSDKLKHCQTPVPITHEFFFMYVYTEFKYACGNVFNALYFSSNK